MTNGELTFPTNKFLINGEWVVPSKNKKINLLNPSNGQILSSVARGNEEDIEKAVAAANSSLSDKWGALTSLDRGRILIKMSQTVKKYEKELAILEANDVGKPLTQAKNDVNALARYLEFYGGAADKLHGITIPYIESFTVYCIRERLGVTAHIIPWNYPMQIIGRSVCASLAVGNACILKPSEEACLTALAFGEIALESGLPNGALNIVTGLGTEVGSSLASNKNINHISFTGSVKTGSIIQQLAAPNITPTTLELGGKSPQIVFADADLNRAIPFLINAGIQNSGQTCSASSRILVEKSIVDKIIRKMSLEYKKLRVGPASDDFEVGPVISSVQKEKIRFFEEKGKDLDLIAEGLLVESALNKGFYVTPKLYFTKEHQHVLTQEEIFGPIQVIIPFKNEAEAIEIANSTEFGLVASVWTENGGRQMRVAKKVAAGQVFVNNYGAGGGVELPFGGVKRSGYGREKGFEALYGFSQLKTIANFHG